MTGPKTGAGHRGSNPLQVANKTKGLPCPKDTMGIIASDHPRPSNFAVAYRKCPLIPRGHFSSAHDHHHSSAHTSSRRFKTDAYDYREKNREVWRSWQPILAEVPLLTRGLNLLGWD